ncbi:hypothetical protein JZ751_016846, partial [Albula glossodonta]
MASDSIISCSFLCMQLPVNGVIWEERAGGRAWPLGSDRVIIKGLSLLLVQRTPEPGRRAAGQSAERDTHTGKWSLHVFMLRMEDHYYQVLEGLCAVHASSWQSRMERGRRGGTLNRRHCICTFSPTPPPALCCVWADIRPYYDPPGWLSSAPVIESTEETSAPLCLSVPLILPACARVKSLLLHQNSTYDVDSKSANLSKH